MHCEICSSEMTFLYDVSERETTFVLWECECGHKLLERRPYEGIVALLGEGQVVESSV